MVMTGVTVAAGVGAGDGVRVALDFFGAAFCAESGAAVRPATSNIPRIRKLIASPFSITLRGKRIPNRMVRAQRGAPWTRPSPHPSEVSGNSGLLLRPRLDRALLRREELAGDISASPLVSRRRHEDVRPDVARPDDRRGRVPGLWSAR